MRNSFLIKAISPELVLEIDDMIKKIQETFKLNISKLEASKIVAWKSKNTKLTLTDKRLIEILGVNP